MHKGLLIILSMVISLSTFCQKSDSLKPVSVVSEAKKKMDSTLVKPKLEILKRTNYSIEIPAGWKTMANCQDNLCSLVSPADSLGGYDIFSENINFTVNKIEVAYTVEKYTTFSISYLPSVVKGFKLLEKKKIKPNAFRVVYAGEKSGYKQTWRQYYYVKNQKVYIVTFACETPKYQYYLSLVEPALNSFKIF